MHNKRSAVSGFHFSATHGTPKSKAILDCMSSGMPAQRLQRRVKTWFTKSDPFKRKRQQLIYLRFGISLAPQMGIKAPMEEKRKYQRTEIDEPAYVTSAGSVMSCMVRNISPEGAAIDVENPAFVPAHFRLVMASDSSIRECDVIWIQQKRIGVAFVPAPQDATTPDRTRQAVEPELAPDRPAVTTP